MAINSGQGDVGRDKVNQWNIHNSREIHHLFLFTFYFSRSPLYRQRALKSLLLVQRWHQDWVGAGAWPSSPATPTCRPNRAGAGPWPESSSRPGAVGDSPGTPSASAPTHGSTRQLLPQRGPWGTGPGPSPREGVTRQENVETRTVEVESRIFPTNPGRLLRPPTASRAASPAPSQTLATTTA